MKRLLFFALCLTLTTLFSGPLYAADKKFHFPIKDALESAEAREKLSSNVKYYFGSQRHPSIRANLGEYVSNKKTNSFAKKNEDACNRAFLSALISFEERANSLGANAVVGIESYYKKNVYSSPTHYECHVGAIMAGVALRGKVVKAAGR